MLLKIVCVAFFVAAGSALQYRDDGQEYSEEDSNDHYGGYHQANSEEFDPVRFKRFKAKPTVKTLSPQEVQDVRGAINKILSGYNQVNPFTPLPPVLHNEKRSIPGDSSGRQKARRTPPSHDKYPNYVGTKFQEYATDGTASFTQTPISDPLTKDDLSHKTLKLSDYYESEADNSVSVGFIGATINPLTSMPEILSTGDVMRSVNESLSAGELITAGEATGETTETIIYNTESNFALSVAPVTALTRTKSYRDGPDHIKYEANRILRMNEDDIEKITPTKPNVQVKPEKDVAGGIMNILPPGLLQLQNLTSNLNITGNDTWHDIIMMLTTTGTPPVETTTTTPVPTTTTTTVETTPTTESTEAANTTVTESISTTENVTAILHRLGPGPVVAKCYVCGLTVGQIPRDGYCADAFARELLPLHPFDATARGKKPQYRKYCRYADIPHWWSHRVVPHSVFGRWSGGCSVRWLDVTSVYTQRTCRSRERATVGRHYVSKRMAKLEMALGKVENGCIVSPMAALVPLSRAVSLYARFHVCVCTGSWCNGARRAPAAAAAWLLAVLLTAYVSDIVHALV